MGYCSGLQQSSFHPLQYYRRSHLIPNNQLIHCPWRRGHLRTGNFIPVACLSLPLVPCVVLLVCASTVSTDQQPLFAWVIGWIPYGAAGNMAPLFDSHHISALVLVEIHKFTENSLKQGTVALFWTEWVTDAQIHLSKCWGGGVGRRWGGVWHAF